MAHTMAIATARATARATAGATARALLLCVALYISAACLHALPVGTRPSSSSLLLAAQFKNKVLVPSEQSLALSAYS